MYFLVFTNLIPIDGRLFYKPYFYFAKTWKTNLNKWVWINSPVLFYNAKTYFGHAPKNLKGFVSENENFVLKEIIVNHNMYECGSKFLVGQMPSFFLENVLESGPMSWHYYSLSIVLSLRRCASQKTVVLTLLDDRSSLIFFDSDFL